MRGTETILLVEDEAQVRAIVARMLEAQGYTVLQAAHGEAALELLESAAPIDLLLTDLIMPRMGGRELAERVRELRPGLRVLFTSGYTEDVIVQNRLLDHDIMLLHKPFTRAALAAKVRETLDAPVRAA
jgi:CheY-like chemotaxis protein